MHSQITPVKRYSTNFRMLYLNLDFCSCCNLLNAFSSIYFKAEVMWGTIKIKSLLHEKFSDLYDYVYTQNLSVFSWYMPLQTFCNIFLRNTWESTLHKSLLEIQFLSPAFLSGWLILKVKSRKLFNLHVCLSIHG